MTNNLNNLLNDVEGYCQVLNEFETVVKNTSKYDIARLVRNEIKQEYNLSKCDFNLYYRMYRGRQRK